MIQRPGSASSLTTGGIRQGHRGLFKVQLGDFKRSWEIFRVEQELGLAQRAPVQRQLRPKISKKRSMN